MPDTPLLLFVCLHGSAKSQIAAAHAGRIAQARGLALRAASAGIEPDADIPPGVTAGLLRDGLAVTDPTPRAVTPALLGDARVVVSFGCDITSPAADHSHGIVTRWDDVPAVSDGYDEARREIVRRVAALLDDEHVRGRLREA